MLWMQYDVMVEHAVLFLFSAELETNCLGLKTFHGIHYIVGEYVIFFLHQTVPSRH